MLLSAILEPLLKYKTVSWADVDITDVTADSRCVRTGSLFIARSGSTVDGYRDGHDYATEAVAAGAAAVLVERSLPGLTGPQIIVPSTRFASAIVAAEFHRHPSRSLRMIGVTGTNGKSTTTYLIEYILQQQGHNVGVLGTIGKRLNGQTIESANTTPEAVGLQSVLREMVDAGCQYGVMEVSSHALEQCRVAGTHYAIAVFTNLSQDHLDYHGSMESYRAAKGKLFSRLGNDYASTKADQSFAVLNADDAAFSYMQSQTVVQTVSYGIQQDADVRAHQLEITAEGARFRVETFAGQADITLPLTGRFNVYNALAAIAVGLVEGLSIDAIANALSSAPGVPGRFEKVDEGQPYHVLVDYSHTPDSVQNALDTIAEFATGRILTVVGCGGDRDKTKRPLMAQIAVSRSDLTLLTSDNPRTENPESILDDMEVGALQAMACGQRAGNYIRLVNRKEAISHAISLALPGDVILIAGKGHETYQIVGQTKTDFDDRAVARQAIVCFGRGAL